MDPLKIAFVTSEVAPFVKTGGLADVSAALPAALAQAGHDVRIIVPLYAASKLDGVMPEPVARLQNVPMKLGPHTYHYSVFRTELPGSRVPVLLVHCPVFYGRQGIYTSDGDESLRFVLLSRAALDICQLAPWAPDIIHCNDWQTALIPIYLRTLYAWDELFAKTRTLLTIHNLGYQGVFNAQILGDIGLGHESRLFHQEDLRAGIVNFLRTGLLYASMLSTVSPTYAREIQTAAYGVGLESILSARWESLVGILNGVDYAEWDPATDPRLPATYTRKTLSRKELSRQALMEKFRLPFSPGAPILGIVSRLATQKGFELVGEALPGILGRHDCRFVVLGSGEPRYEDLFEWMRRTYPQQVGFFRGYDNDLAHLIEAGSDMFLMPSRYEPCGLNQMYSLRYGTVPIVRNTGGLADTVQHYDPATGEGTGFVFEHFTGDGLNWAVETALGVWPDRESWRKLQQRGMACDYSWLHQSRLYEELYRRMLGR